MTKMKRSPVVVDEKDMIDEVRSLENNVNKAPVKELPTEELTMDDKLFEIKKTIESHWTQTINGLKHLEKKIDYIFNMISGKIPKR